MNISFLGLILIACGWLSILLNIKSNKGKITKFFLILYITGVTFLILDGIKSQPWNLIGTNFVCLIFSGLIAIKLNKKDR